MGIELVPPISIASLVILAFANPLIGIATKNRRAVEVPSLAVLGLVALLNTWMLLDIVRSGKRIVYIFSGWPPPLGIAYEVDSGGALMGATISVIMFLLAIYSLGYVEEKHHLYYTLLAVIEVGMLGTVYTCDVFNLFVMLEVASIAAYALVSFERGKRAIFAALRYGIYGALATTIFLLGIAYLYACFGTVNMADLTAKIHGMSFPLTRVVGVPQLALMVFTFACLWMVLYKSAVFPNHFWLPEAHSEAPTPVSALLSGLLVATGVYVYARVFTTVMEGTSAASLALRLGFALGLITAFLGSLAMLVERDVKRFIAYSTIANMGLATCCISVATPLAIGVGLAYLANHAIAKALAFLSVGPAIRGMNTRSIEKLAGVGRACPWIGVPLAVSMMSLGGVPPLNMFFAKLLLYTSIASGLGIPWALLAAVPSIVSFVGYAKVMYSLCLKPFRGSSAPRIPKSIVLTLAILTIACMVSGIITLLYTNALLEIGKSFTDWKGYVESVETLARLLRTT